MILCVLNILSLTLFGITAPAWRKNNKDKKGNIRDYANISQLVCLANLEKAECSVH